jgi:hypothetical protein
MSRSVQDRLEILEKHAMWMAPQGSRVGDIHATRWLLYSVIGIMATLALFVSFAVENGVHDHFVTPGFRDGSGVVKIYDKPIKNEGMYILALLLGVTVAAVEKIIIEPGKHVLHHAMVQKRYFPSTWSDSLLVLFFETSSVLMATVTTFFYFTNVFFLLCVVLGRMIGTLVVSSKLHAQEIRGEKYASKEGGYLAF